MSKKSDSLTVAQRVEEITQIRLRGAMSSDVVRHAAEQQWNISERQIRNYLEQSDLLIEKILEPDRRKHLARHLAMRQVLYAHAFSNADFSTAKAILADEAALLGLYTPKRTELTGADGGPLKTESTVVMSDAELATALNGLLETLGQTSPDEVGS